MRVVITGHPHSGKTTLAEAFSSIVKHTDDLIESHEWSSQSEAASYWFDISVPFVLEGCAIPRALRKWKLRHPGSAPPMDVFIYLERERLTPQAKGIETVMRDLWPWLTESGIMILTSKIKKVDQ
jgi:energy-coupling factor transporter ATP-binding protein EcfA2